MTLRLILTRHASSDWDEDCPTDHDRTLNTGGRKDAPLIGSWLARQGYAPEHVLCSSAQRTRETWAGLSPTLGFAGKFEIDPRLYQANPAFILQRLQQVEQAQVVMIIAHNPGIARAAISFAAAPPADRQFQRYPPAATTVLEFQAETWSGVKWGTGHIAAFTVPRAQQ
jgi:phosphohistidine phosphatase